MIAFSTLFLGLVVGPHPVEVVVGDEVATVEITLDGRRLGTIQGEPWKLSCDFGAELRPQRLEAVAYDGEHNEIARAEQILNLPQPPAVVSFVVDTDASSGTPFARLSWESRVGGEPTSVAAWLDGEPLVVEDPRRIALPPLDRRRLHLFSAELAFGENVSPRVTGTFGGTFADQVETELTAVPILVTGKKKKLSVEAMRGWFTRQGRPIEPVAVEKGRSDVVLVLGSQLPETYTLATPSLRTRSLVPLKDSQIVRLLHPFADRSPGVATTFNLYPMSPDYTSRDGGLFWLLTRVRFHGQLSGRRRLADAVAVAGLAAHERSHRRVVILLFDGTVDDASDLTPEHSRRYLERLNVPFALWTPRLDEHEIEGWGKPTSVRSLAQLGRAFDRLNKQLNRQYIVWFEGRHLPQEIELSAAAEGVASASSAPGPRRDRRRN